MKHFSCASLLLIAATSLCGNRDAVAESWQSGGTLPGTKQHAFAVERGGVIYAIGGTPWVNGGDQDGSVYQWSGGSWSGAAALDGIGPAVPIGGGIDALGRIVFFGGVLQGSGDPGPSGVYDPAGGPQGNIAPPPGSAQRLGFASASDDQGRLYWIGGGAAPSASAFCARYSAVTNSWSTVAPLPTAVRNACACYDGAGHILVFGGQPGGGSVATADVMRFDIAAGPWSSTAIPDLPAAVSGARAVLGADRRVYVIGGLDANGAVRNTVNALSLTSNSWEPAAPLGTARQQFAAVRGTDDYIYAIGGTGGNGAALSSVERIFTAVCPELPPEAAPYAVWTGQTAVLPAHASGGGTILYAWSHAGKPISDGATGTGSIVSGAFTSTLSIANIGPADAGTYEVAATNSCGTVAAPVATLSLQLPPAVPTSWRTINLHPAWAKSSAATCVSGSRQGGSAAMDIAGYTNVSQAVIWSGSASSAQNVTPPDSAGGGINDMDGNTAVGWWWWPYQCYAGTQASTCYTQQAAKWESGAATFTNLQWSGWEYSMASAVRGGVIGGHVTNDDAVGNYWWHGLLWDFNGSSGTDLQPMGTSSSDVSSIDGERQYGEILTPYPGPTYHAAMWSGSPATFVDMHPAGASASFVTDAADGLQVGYTGYPYDGAKACLWSSSAQSYTNLHPAGASLSHAYAVSRGIIMGDATMAGVTKVGYWSAGSLEFHELDSVLKPEGFSYVSVASIQIAADGTVTLVGSGYHLQHARNEALMWTTGNALLGDVNSDGRVDGADLGVLLGSWGPCSGCPADLNGDGTVDGADLGLLLGTWTS